MKICLKIGVFLLLIFFILALIPVNVAGFESYEDIITGSYSVNGTTVMAYASIDHTALDAGEYCVVKIQYSLDQNFEDAGNYFNDPSYYSHVDHSNSLMFNKTNLLPSTVYYYRAFCYLMPDVTAKVGTTSYFTTGTPSDNVELSGLEYNDLTYQSVNISVTQTTDDAYMADKYSRVYINLHNLNTGVNMGQFMVNDTVDGVIGHDWTNLDDETEYRYSAVIAVYWDSNQTLAYFEATIEKYFTTLESPTGEEEFLGYSMDIWNTIFCLGVVMFFFILPTLITKDLKKPIPKEVNIMFGFLAVIGLTLFGFLPVWLMFIFALILVVFIILKLKRW